MTTPLPDAAVEAAAKAFVNLGWQSERQWDSFAPSLQDDFRRQIRAALTAARPLMEAEAKAEAWDEGYDAGCNDEAFEARGIPSDPGSKEHPHANPYRERGDGA